MSYSKIGCQISMIIFLSICCLIVYKLCMDSDTIQCRYTQDQDKINTNNNNNNNNIPSTSTSTSSDNPLSCDLNNEAKVSSSLSVGYCLLSWTFLGLDFTSDPFPININYHHDQSRNNNKNNFNYNNLNNNNINNKDTPPFAFRQYANSLSSSSRVAINTGGENYEIIPLHSAYTKGIGIDWFQSSSVKSLNFLFSCEKNFVWSEPKTFLTAAISTFIFTLIILIIFYFLLKEIFNTIILPFINLFIHKTDYEPINNNDDQTNNKTQNNNSINRSNYYNVNIPNEVQTPLLYNQSITPSPSSKSSTGYYNTNYPMYDSLSLNKAQPQPPSQQAQGQASDLDSFYQIKSATPSAPPLYHTDDYINVPVTGNNPSAPEPSAPPQWKYYDKS